MSNLIVALPFAVLGVAIVASAWLETRGRS